MPILQEADLEGCPIAMEPSLWNSYLAYCIAYKREGIPLNQLSTLIFIVPEPYADHRERVEQALNRSAFFQEARLRAWVVVEKVPRNVRYIEIPKRGCCFKSPMPFMRVL